MEITGVEGVPLGPDVRVLSEGSISSAWNITEDPVKLEWRLLVRIGLVWDHEVGHDGSIMIGHDDAWGL